MSVLAAPRLFCECADDWCGEWWWVGMRDGGGRCVETKPATSSFYTFTRVIAWGRGLYNIIHGSLCWTLATSPQRGWPALIHIQHPPYPVQRLLSV